MGLYLTISWSGMLKSDLIKSGAITLQLMPNTCWEEIVGYLRLEGNSFGRGAHVSYIYHLDSCRD